tara:strand:+ start:8416 stop:8601 length:186 start_codon:yes stop_codon:yes gene_type:complete
MIEIKKVNNQENALGYSLIILWIFSITFSYNIIRGDHITLGVCLGPLETSVCLSVWRKLLP